MVLRMAAPSLVPATTVHAGHGMVASADGLATQAGIAMLQAGGSAADAAIAANAVLAVTGPHMCGMGGDLFALVHHRPGPPAVLNASGRAGTGADLERLRAEGHTTMPFRHDVRSVPVPGCVDGWLALHERFGRLPLADVLAPAIAYASQGFPASPLLAASAALLTAPVPEAGRALAAQAQRQGDMVTRPGVAEALRAIVAHGRDGFYGGAFGEGLLALGGGEYAPGDLESPQADWVAPLGLEVWGHHAFSVPPNSQGYLTLAGAWIAAHLELPADDADPRWPHLLVEAALAAGHDRPEVLHEHADGDALIAPDRLAARRSAIRVDAARDWGPGAAVQGDTTYLCAVDGDGMGVSLIQSNASGFGSPLFEPNTGINLHNRGIGFSVDPAHSAAYGPRRRPPHTLSPALLTRSSGELAMVIGTQGGDGQPQILLQLLARLLQLGEAPGRALARPRWVLTGSGQGFDTWTAGRPVVLVEDHAPAAWMSGLEDRGHVVRSAPAFDHGFGHAQVILSDPRGVLAGSTDARARIGACAGI